jgi:type II secretory pathway component PulK
LKLQGPWSSRAASGGSILIVVLWVVFFLGILSVAIGAYVGGNVELARRMSDRLQASYAARAGVATGLAVLMADSNAWDALNEPWADSARDFKEVSCGGGVYSVYYVLERADGSWGTNYGVRDEQARIDLNLLPESRVELLTALLQTAGGLDRVDAARLTQNIQVARTLPDRRKMQSPGVETGWASPGLSCGPFLPVHELLWVKGMNRDVFERIRDHLTVSGGSRININTADGALLRALFSRGEATKWDVGAVDRLVRKILNFRESGGIFKTLRNLAADLAGHAELSEEERRQLNGASPFVTIASDVFRGHAYGERKGRTSGAQGIEFVWNRKLNRIEYWHED